MATSHPNGSGSWYRHLSSAETTEGIAPGQFCSIHQCPMEAQTLSDQHLDDGVDANAVR
jgi:hypothetical protein